MTAPIPTAEFASLVYGPGGVLLDDPAETFHEASSLYPDVAPGRLQSLLELQTSLALQQTVARAGFTRDHLPGTDLPPAALGTVALRDALVSRRSRTAETAGSLSLTALGSLVGAAYRSADDRRPVPSGGALYPLELYVVALRVDSVGAGVHHYSPYRHRLEFLRPVDHADVAPALVEPELVDTAAALIVLTAMFWRSRFKWDRPQVHNAVQRRRVRSGHLAAPHAGN